MHFEHDLTGRVVLGEHGAGNGPPTDDDRPIRLHAARSGRAGEDPYGRLIWRTSVAVLASRRCAYSTYRAGPLVGAKRETAAGELRAVVEHRDVPVGSRLDVVLTLGPPSGSPTIVSDWGVVVPPSFQSTAPGIEPDSVDGVVVTSRHDSWSSAVPGPFTLRSTALGGSS